MITSFFRKYDLKNRAVFSLFEVSVTRTSGVVIGLIVLDLIWWAALYTSNVPMSGMAWLMDQGLPRIAPGAMELATLRLDGFRPIVDYLVMWGVMMGAMMYPAMTRFTRDYAGAHQGSSATVGSAVAAFLASYSVIWGITGVVPLTVQWLLPGGIYSLTRTYPHLVIGGVLVLTGLYQLSSFKQQRLRTCCSRIEPHNDGIMKALRRGVSHGGNCVLVCFGFFFLLMPFFGSMNFLWMIALAAVATVERIPATWGKEVAVAAGTAAMLAGLVVLLLQPPLPITFGM